MTSLNKIFDEFNKTYGIEVKGLEHKVASMMNLILDEYDELHCETELESIGLDAEVTKRIHYKDKFVKEAIDLVYITCQQLRERGVNLDAALAEVHRSNMSKSLDVYDDKAALKELEIAKERYPEAELIPHGDKYIIKCAKSGKVVKPTCYSPATITKGVHYEILS